MAVQGIPGNHVTRHRQQFRGQLPGRCQFPLYRPHPPFALPPGWIREHIRPPGAPRATLGRESPARLCRPPQWRSLPAVPPGSTGPERSRRRPRPADGIRYEGCPPPACRIRQSGCGNRCLSGDPVHVFPQSTVDIGLIAAASGSALLEPGQDGRIPARAGPIAAVGRAAGTGTTGWRRGPPTVGPLGRCRDWR